LNITSGYSAQKPLLGDIDNQNGADIINFIGDGQVYVHKSIGNGVTFENNGRWLTNAGYSNQNPMLGDVDGDNDADIVNFIGNGQVYVHKSTGNSFENNGLWHSNTGRSNEIPLLGFMNGESVKKIDIVNLINDGRRYVSFSFGNDFDDTNYLW
jgi:hypothetical protein